MIARASSSRGRSGLRLLSPTVSNTVIMPSEATQYEKIIRGQAQAHHPACPASEHISILPNPAPPTQPSLPCTIINNTNLTLTISASTSPRNLASASLHLWASSSSPQFMTVEKRGVQENVRPYSVPHHPRSCGICCYYYIPESPV